MDNLKNGLTIKKDIGFQRDNINSKQYHAGNKNGLDFSLS